MRVIGWSKVLRAVCVCVIAMGASVGSARPAEASSMTQCAICPNITGCPFDVHDYDDACYTACGPTVSYAGACWLDGAFYGCGGPAIVCYYPAK